MNTNTTHGIGTHVNMDWNVALINLGVSKDQDQVEIQIDARHARKLALQLLESAEKAEEQRQILLNRAIMMMQQGSVDHAAELAERVGFTDAELNTDVKNVQIGH